MQPATDDIMRDSTMQVVDESMSVNLTESQLRNESTDRSQLRNESTDSQLRNGSTGSQLRSDTILDNLIASETDNNMESTSLRTRRGQSFLEPVLSSDTSDESEMMTSHAGQVAEQDRSDIRAASGQGNGVVIIPGTVLHDLDMIIESNDGSAMLGEQGAAVSIQRNSSNVSDQPEVVSRNAQGGMLGQQNMKMRSGGRRTNVMQQQTDRADLQARQRSLLEQHHREVENINTVRNRERVLAQESLRAKLQASNRQ